MKTRKLKLGHSFIDSRDAKYSADLGIGFFLSNICELSTLGVSDIFFLSFFRFSSFAVKDETVSRSRMDHVSEHIEPHVPCRVVWSYARAQHSTRFKVIH